MLAYQVMLTRIEVALEKGFQSITKNINLLQGRGFERIKTASKIAKRGLDCGGLLILKLKESLEKIARLHIEIEKGQIRSSFDKLRLAAINKKLASSIKQQCTSMWTQMAKELLAKDE